METRAIQPGQGPALHPDRDKGRQSGDDAQRQPQRRAPEPAEMRASGPSAAETAGSIAELLGETLWHYQDEAPHLNFSA